MSSTTGTARIGCNRYTVRDVADASGVATSAVRFYEKHGVITAARTTSNQRRFDDSAACRIKVAKLAQRVGLTVREIADVLAALPHRPEAQDWDHIAAALTERAEARITDLRRQLDAMQSAAKLCEIT